MKLPEVRKMTRKQVKALRASGLNPAFYAKALGDGDQKAMERQEDFIDWILDNIYPDFDFDEVPNDECMELAGETFKRSYGGAKETKNS